MGKALLGLSLIALVATLSMLALLWQTTGRGRPICFGNLNYPGQTAILRQGVWSHLQSRPATLAVLEDRAIQGPNGNLTVLDPEAPLDEDEVDQFLIDNPDCCVIEPLGSRFGDISKLRSVVSSHSKVRVFVEDGSLFSSEGFPVVGRAYTVDVCWKNLEAE